MLAEQTKDANGSLIHSARVIAACALGGAVLAGLGFGWVPALAAVDMHAVGAVVGGVAGAIANARNVF